jgi:hypothetical protein
MCVTPRQIASSTLFGFSLLNIHVTEDFENLILILFIYYTHLAGRLLSSQMECKEKNIKQDRAFLAITGCIGKLYRNVKLES